MPSLVVIKSAAIRAAVTAVIAFVSVYAVSPAADLYSRKLFAAAATAAITAAINFIVRVVKPSPTDGATPPAA